MPIPIIAGMCPPNCVVYRVDEGRHLAPGARQIYLINCLAVMQAPLSRHACAEGRAAMLGQRIEGHVAALVGGAVGTTLAHTHIAEIMDRMRLYQVRIPLSCMVV